MIRIIGRYGESNNNNNNNINMKLRSYAASPISDFLHTPYHTTTTYILEAKGQFHKNEVGLDR